jgi:6-phosphogluconolactonase
MAELIVKPSSAMVAEAAAQITCDVLGEAIKSSGQAVWVVGGGTTPMEAYRLLARDYAGQLDWSKVTVLIGDERCAPEASGELNWIHITDALRPLNIPEANLLRPPVEAGPDGAAQKYTETIEDIQHYDLVWMGMGEDGHTLSLFPGHDSEINSDELVTPVFNSPKPPPERISLTLKALQRAKRVLVLVTGVNKSDSLDAALSAESDLPVARAIKAIEAGGGTVQWLADEDAAQVQD